MTVVDAVLVLQRSDIARIAEEPARFEGARLLFVDPGLLDEAAVRGLQNTAFRRLPIGPDFQARAAAEAMARATLLDLLLTREREAVFGGGAVPAPSLHGWDVGVFFLALQRAAVARQLGALVAATFPETRIGLVRPTVVQQLYFDSFVGPDLVAALDPARFPIVDSHAAVRWHRADAHDHVLDAAALRTRMQSGRVGAVTHVPTCFYDRAWLADEVSLAFSHTLDLPAPFWDVPLHRGPEPLLRPLAGLPHDDAAAAYRERALPVLRQALSDLLPQPQARELQLHAWAERCRWQGVQFGILRQALAGTRPHVVLADQDAGLNGVLCSVADGLGSRITVLPHSGHPSMVLPHARRVVAVERAGHGTRARSVLGQRVAVRPVRSGRRPLRRATSPASMPPLRTACLLLNSMQTEGLSHVDAHALAAFHQALQPLCERHDVELILRPKPGAPALSVLAGALGVAPERLVRHTTQPLEELAAGVQLCIAYGEPTTGVAPFLDAGALVLQVGPQCWPADYTVCLPLVHDGVIRSLDPAAALTWLQALLADPAQFDTQRAQQNAAFDARCADAHDHLFSTGPDGDDDDGHESRNQDNAPC